MVDIEKRAFRRDRRFLARLVFGLLAAIGVSIFIFIQLTQSQVSGCAARTFESVTHPE